MNIDWTYELNLYAAWIGILLGFVSGAAQGLFFHRDDWQGGYDSWPRRMMRLGHISFFGLAGINFAFALTAKFFEIADPGIWPGALFIVAAVTMPLTCYLSAFWKSFRHLFPIPVICLLGGTILFIFGGLLS